MGKVEGGLNYVHLETHLPRDCRSPDGVSGPSDRLAVMPLMAQEFDIIVNEMANKSME